VAAIADMLILFLLCRQDGNYFSELLLRRVGNLQLVAFRAELLRFKDSFLIDSPLE
jgi:hypothetical protein